MNLHKGAHRGDCYFWKSGSCKYNEKDCGKGLHLDQMFDFFNQVKGTLVTATEANSAPVVTSAPPAQVHPAPANTASFLGAGSCGLGAELQGSWQ